MKDLRFIRNPSALPAPADSARAAAGIEDWLRMASGQSAQGFATRLAKDKAGRALLAAAFGNSPYLTQSLLLDIDFACAALATTPGEAFSALVAGLTPTALPSATPEFMAGLRLAKRRAALIVALADIADVWNLDDVTRALSDFADRAVDLALAHVLRLAAISGAFLPRDEADICNESGLIILGMGKLGGRELNYSSDIDLIVLYDEERFAVRDRDGPQRTAVRLTQSLLRILDERTSEGYVFRTDLRLRPDPGATPVAMSTLAAETYYEGMGQNWERAAMIKARPIAGDREAGRVFLARLRPYIWRKHLDFAAIQDIHSIKRQIDAHGGGGTIALAGHNLKLGRGGIREIEFFAQTQQLIWGGRDPSLRSQATCEALAALAASGRIAADTARELTEAYRYLRRAEHRVQMVEDRQTHSLPPDDAGLAALASFLGHASRGELEAAMLSTLRIVERHYAMLFEAAPTLSGPGNLVFTGIEDDPETMATLAGMGFSDPRSVASRIREWHHGRYRAMRSARARELLTELTPALLAALAKSAQPDTALVNFDEFLSRLPAGVQIFSLFHANPGLLDLVAEVMGDAPLLAERLARHSNLLDSVLASGFLDALPGREALAAELSGVLEQARDYQDVLDLTRRWANERKFQAGVQLLRGLRSAEEIGRALSGIAEAAIGVLLPIVETDFARGHGRVEGDSLVVVALGKLGGREMTVTSDLDLIFLYRGAPGIESSDGPRSLPLTAYYARLSQRLINALTALTGEGQLYTVDMRLRPSGTKGPIAVSLDAFELYHRDSAWTWEHMALTRARTIAGPLGLRHRADEAIRKVLVRPRDPDRLAVDVADMRQRIAREHPGHSFWDIKYRAGGLIDVEFIAQYLQLRHAAAHPEILAQSAASAIEHAAEAGLIARTAATNLDAALRLWHAVHGLMRLTIGDDLDEATAGKGLLRALARGAGAADIAALKRQMETAAGHVRRHFADIIEGPARQAPGKPTET
ncbi:MAG: bifunctional [glutamine synthetase] adenylyltransferase/[glutamine synthetase]-adenylyl-L-tyrosine phosphorylase [Rhodospirillaceae bacterium]|nr:bifunctional [glutamine synthetase] adenylyltransferase/[glutamine synthetase]-adenylyl-L-tyrosine phosphorylase [Rhodospirillaceae bacterium]